MTKSRLLTVAALILTLSALTAPAAAELNAFMRIKGQKQGDIKGSSTQKGRENQIIVIAVDHSLTMPRDRVTGQATGKRQHGPLTITKELDKSSPALRNALVNNELLTEVVLMFWQVPKTGAAGGAGAEAQYFTITLKNASVSGIHEVMANNKDSALASRAAYEEVQLTYESITWTWTDGGVSASDSWSTAQ